MKRTSEKMFFLILLSSFLLQLLCPICVFAKSDENDIDLTDLDRQAEGFSFSDMVTALTSGDMEKFMDEIKDGILSSASSSFAMQSENMKKILALGILGAVFANFSSVFSDSQVSETGFFITYLMMFLYLSSGFYISTGIAADTLRKMTEFLKTLMPAYFLATAWTGATASSAVFYETMFFSVHVVTECFLKVMLPLVRIYILLVLASNMVQENILSRMTELLKTVISWSIKTIAGFLIGLHALQGMVLPYVDSVRQSVLNKTVAAVPGIGQGAEAAVTLILGSSSLMKNAIGGAGVAAVFIIAIIPVIKLVLFMMMLKGTAAILQPVCDKRMVECISCMGEGHKMLLMIVSVSAVLFMAVLAMICQATNVNYLAG